MHPILECCGSLPQVTQSGIEATTRYAGLPRWPAIVLTREPLQTLPWQSAENHIRDFSSAQGSTGKHTWKTPQSARYHRPVNTHIPAVQSACSRGTSCKPQHLQGPVGEDFSGNQLDQLSGFIEQHASVKSKHTPSSLQAATPSADLNHSSSGHRSAVSRLQSQVARCLRNQREFRPHIESTASSSA
jgi:hypothetical protein